MTFLWLRIAAAAVILLALVLYIRGAEKAKSEVRALRSQVSSLVVERDEARAGAVKNQKSLEQCLLVNAANQTEARRQAELAATLEARVRMLRETAEREAESIRREAGEMRGLDHECRTLDEPLPAAFVDWLRE